jgi:hypothetical protein
MFFAFNHDAYKEKLGPRKTRVFISVIENRSMEYSSKAFELLKYIYSLVFRRIVVEHRFFVLTYFIDF